MKANEEENAATNSEIIIYGELEGDKWSGYLLNLSEYLEFVECAKCFRSFESLSRRSNPAESLFTPPPVCNYVWLPVLVVPFIPIPPPPTVPTSEEFELIAPYAAVFAID